MNFPLFISKRLFSDSENSNRFSKSIIRFALWGITLGMIVMILSIAIMVGYKSSVVNKVVGFENHLSITNYEGSSSFEMSPISSQQEWLPELEKHPMVDFVQVFSTKPGIIKTGDQIHGTVLKGVGHNYNWTFIKEHLIEGELLEIDTLKSSTGCMLSEKTANILNKKVGDKLDLFFLNKEETAPRRRRFVIKGIYSTQLDEFDKLFMVVDHKQIRKLNNWKADEVSGFEIRLKEFDDLDYMTRFCRELSFNFGKEDFPSLRVQSVRRKYAAIFDWLNITDMNVWLILSLVIAVAGFNMVSALLILILERTRMIGVLKALGATNRSIRRIFLSLAAFLIGRGMFWGNIIGVGFCFIQKKFGIIQLDPDSYYMSTVPVELRFLDWILLNLGTLLLIILMLVIPALFISKIKPDKAIRFD